MASKRTNFLFWSDRLDVHMVIPPIESVSCSLHLRHTPLITSTTLALEKHGSDMDGTIMNRPVRIFHASPRVQDHIHVLSSPNGPSIAVTRAHLARHDDAFLLLARRGQRPCYTILCNNSLKKPHATTSVSYPSDAHRNMSSATRYRQSLRSHHPTISYYPSPRHASLPTTSQQPLPSSSSYLPQPYSASSPSHDPPLQPHKPNSSPSSPLSSPPTFPSDIGHLHPPQ